MYSLSSNLQNIVDKKKVLNPPIPLTQKKKEVKDFKEEVEQIDEISKKTLGSYVKKASHDARMMGQIATDFENRADKARLQSRKDSNERLHKKYLERAWKRDTGISKAVDRLTKEETQLDELNKSTYQSYRDKAAKDVARAYDIHQNPYKKTAKDDMRKLSNRVKGDERAEIALKEEDLELIAKHEVKADAPHKSGGHVILTKSSNKWHVLHNNKSSPTVKDLHRSKLLHSYNDEKEARAKFKELKEEQINEISKKTLGSYINKAEKEADRYQQNYTKLRDIRDKTHGRFSDDTAELKQLDRKAVNRDNGVYTAKQKLAKEEVQIDEVSKSTLMRYIPSAARDVGSYTHAGKEAGEHAAQHTRAGDKRIAGIDRATKKLGTQKEEVELDESNRLSHALTQVGKSKWHIYDTKTKEVHSTYNNKNVAMKKYDELNDKHAGYDSPGGLVQSKYGVRKEETEINEATVSSRKYDWGTMKTINHGKSFSIPLHPEHHEPIAKLKHGESHSFKDETGRKWKATREHDTVHFHGGSYGTQKTSVPHSSLTEAYTDKQYDDAIKAYLKKGGKVETLPTRKPRPSEKTFINRTGSIWKKGYTKSAVSGFNNKSQTTVDDRNKHIREETVEESRGHKVLATFFKNREVAQRAFTGQNDKEKQPTYNEKGIETPEDKKKVNEATAGVSAKAPSVATPKKTKSTAKEYASAAIPGTKRVATAKPDNNEVGGGTATRIQEDQYAADYKIKYYVDPITGENKTRKIRPHRVNFANSKMRGEPAQADAQGDYGMKESYVVEGGFDNYHEIAKELVKRHGKNVDTSHINDLAGERDTHRGLDHSEVMHHVKKILSSKEVKEGDEYDEKWKEYKGKTFKKESRMLNFNDYLKEAKLSAKQKKIAAIAGDKDKIDADDLAALRAGKKPVEEASCSDKDMKKEELVGNQHKLDKNKNGKLDAQDFKMLRKEEAEQIDELSKDTLNSYVKGAATDLPRYGNTLGRLQTHGKLKDVEKSISRSISNRHTGIGRAVDRLAKEEVQIDEGKMKDIYTDMMDHATKKGYSSHKEFTPADYETVGKLHGISGKELAVIAGHKTAQQAANEAVDTVEKDASGKVKSWSHEGDWKKTDKKDPEGKVHNLVGQALKKTKELSKEEVERIEAKLAKLDEGIYKPEVEKSFPASGVKTGASAPKGTSTMPKDKEKAKGQPAGSIGEEVEQIDELSKATLGSYAKKATDSLRTHQAKGGKNVNGMTGDELEHQLKAGKRASGIKTAVDKLTKEETEQEMSPYLKATLSFMDESKYDDYKDALRAKKATQSAFDKDFKPDTTHPHIQVVKGTQYGGENQKDDEGDEKPEAEKEKRGRGRPSGSKSGARLKGGGHEDGGIPVHNLHLPKSYK
ncbi:hypothetical protein EB001_10580 [bacterium]|nr:hypothetical protein [bacterium]